MKQFFRYSDGVLPNLSMLVYALSGYVGGVYLITIDGLLINSIGTLFLAHSMVIAAYLIHECAHNTIFMNNKANARLGAFLGWITGTCYGDYEEIRKKHFRHHIDRADIVAFDYRPKFESHPVFMKVIKTFEWFYIPAVEIVMHLLVLVVPFVLPSRKQQRGRVIYILLIRVTAFGILIWKFPRLAFFYPMAYMLFLTVMRFMDTHQHTYELFETLEQPRGKGVKQFDRAYEQRNTFSNLFSVKYPWVNLFVLNFGYHNAHHVKPITPWYRLPAFHKELFGENSVQVLPFKNLLSAYHRYRVPRMLNADASDSGIAERQGVDFIGVDGVSFLTAH